MYLKHKTIAEKIIKIFEEEKCTVSDARHIMRIIGYNLDVSPVQISERFKNIPVDD